MVMVFFWGGGGQSCLQQLGSCGVCSYHGAVKAATPRLGNARGRMLALTVNTAIEFTGALLQAT